ncbi:hypothetical protein JCM13304A_16380 [Desulfothermus okinawensis JCM 13304]
MKKTYLSRRDFLFAFRQRFSTKPSRASSFTNKDAKKADEYLSQGKYEDARDIYLKMVEERSDNLVARQKLAYCYYKLGDIKNSMKEFLELKKRGVKSNFVSLYLGLCFAHRGDIPNAILSLKGFFDITKPIVQRAINLQIALYDSNMAKKEDLINCIEGAIEEQNKMDTATSI